MIGENWGDSAPTDRSSMCAGCLTNYKGGCVKAHMLGTRYTCSEAVYRGMRCTKISGRPFKRSGGLCRSDPPPRLCSEAEQRGVAPSD